MRRTTQLSYDTAPRGQQTDVETREIAAKSSQNQDKSNETNASDSQNQAEIPRSRHNR
jgi:hypothetical protein